MLKPSPAGDSNATQGGAKGIGAMISAGFVANGARVYICSRDGPACEKYASELTAKGAPSRAQTLACAR